MFQTKSSPTQSICTGQKGYKAKFGITPIDKEIRDPRQDTENSGRLFERVCGEDGYLSADMKCHSAGFRANRLGRKIERDLLECAPAIPWPHSITFTHLCGLRALYV